MATQDVDGGHEHGMALELVGTVSGASLASRKHGIDITRIIVATCKVIWSSTVTSSPLQLYCRSFRSVHDPATLLLKLKHFVPPSPPPCCQAPSKDL